MSSREQRLVELVGPDGSPAGSSTVAQAHTAPGQLHRAFSVVLFDHNGQMLLQRRAAVKTRFPLAWANTCCGHPAPGESPAVAARNRLTEELGLREITLTDAGVYVYAADDPATGLVEREYDHVLVATVSGDIVFAPDPAEVATTRWVPADWTPGTDGHAPWLVGVLTVARSVALNG